MDAAVYPYAVRKCKNIILCCDLLLQDHRFLVPNERLKRNKVFAKNAIKSSSIDVFFSDNTFIANRLIRTSKKLCKYFLFMKQNRWRREGTEIKNFLL